MSQLLQVLFASGTGTTAYLTSRYLNNHKVTGNKSLLDIEIIALPCATSAEELLHEMKQLEEQFTSLSDIHQNDIHIPYPIIIEPTTETHFAEPNLLHLMIWKSLQETIGVEFDLIYTPRAFEILLSHVNPAKTQIEGMNWNQYSLVDLYPGTNIMYYHCGGIEGNLSQLGRYKYKKISIPC